MKDDGINKDVQFLFDVQEENGEWVLSKGLHGDKMIRRGWESDPTRGDPNGVAVHRLNHSGHLGHSTTIVSPPTYDMSREHGFFRCKTALQYELVIRESTRVAFL